MMSDTDAGIRAGKFLRNLVTSYTRPGFNYGYQNSPGSAEIIEPTVYDREKGIPRGLDPAER